MTTINFGEAKLSSSTTKHSQASKDIVNHFNNHHKEEMLKMEFLNKDIAVFTYPKNSVAKVVERGTEDYKKNISYSFKPDSSHKQATRNALKVFMQKLKIK